ncbi:hypothetical protein FKW77_006996 [Venturia effusa]|uniref:Uncharacterized protein n=1 Tax=Venturia effusa TaxID=50376 RepID=A0A517LHH5_9PEZI|nr:hypothetical protein FKW77_006996 [Venturia effusa]
MSSNMKPMDNDARAEFECLQRHLPRQRNVDKLVSGNVKENTTVDKLDINNKSNNGNELDSDRDAELKKLRTNAINILTIPLHAMICNIGCGVSYLTLTYFGVDDSIAQKLVLPVGLAYGVLYFFFFKG